MEYVLQKRLLGKQMDAAWHAGSYVSRLDWKTARLKFGGVCIDGTGAKVDGG